MACSLSAFQVRCLRLRDAGSVADHIRRRLEIRPASWHRSRSKTSGCPATVLVYVVMEEVLILRDEVGAVGCLIVTADDGIDRWVPTERFGKERERVIVHAHVGVYEYDVASAGLLHTPVTRACRAAWTVNPLEAKPVLGYQRLDRNGRAIVHDPYFEIFVMRILPMRLDSV